MTSSSSLYGTAVTQNTSSTNSTSLYGEPGSPVPDASGNLVVRGDLTVLSGNILTTALTGNIFPQNATTLNIGLAATAFNIGANTGTTTVNNNLAVTGTSNFVGTITGTGADFGNITIAVADDNTITTTTGNLKLASATGNLELNADTGFLYPEGNNRLNRPTFQSTTGNSSGLRIAAPNTGTSANANFSVNNSSDPLNTEFLSMAARGSALTNTFRFLTGEYIAGVLNATNKSIGFLDNTNLYATVNPAGPTIGTDLTTKTYVDSIPNITYTIDATSTTGGANFNLTGSDASVDTIKFASGTGITVSRTDANTITVTNAGVTSITGTANQVIASAGTGAVTLSLPQSIATTSNPTFAGATLGNITVGVADDNTITTTTGDLKLQSATDVLAINPATYIQWAEGSNRLNRLNFKSTTGTSTGIRVQPPIATGGSATISANTTNDLNNTSFINLAAFQAAANPLRIQTGKYIAGVLGASGTSVAFIDNVTTYATVNPAGPTIGTDLTTKTYVDSIVGTVPTYDTNVAPVAGGVELDLRQIVGATYTIVGSTQFIGGTNVTVAETSPNVITISAPDTNTTYNIDATSTTGGANLNLNGSDATTDSVAYKGSGATTVTRTDANTITIASTDTNTTYDFNATTTTGGVNLNLVGSDATTDTVKLSNGGGITATYTSGTEVTLGSTATDANTASAIVARDASGNFSAGTITANLTGNASGTAANVTGIVATANGGTGQTTYTDGQLLIGNSTGNTLTKSTLTAGSGISITNGSGAITIAATGVTGVSSVTGSGFITASPTTGAVTIGSNATDVNTASTIVARDASGNFSAGTITASLSGNATSATTATQVANSLTAGTHLTGGPFNGSAAVTLSTDATDANTASTIVARDASGNFSAGTLTANLADASYILGALQASTNTGYSFMAPVLNTISNNNGLDAATSFTTPLGNGAQQQLTQYSGDIFAGVNTAPALVFNNALGNSVTGTTVPFTGVASVAPSPIAVANSMGTLNYNGYATSNFTQYAAKAQGGGLNANHALQIQATPAETFADGTLTISGATITAVSRVSVALAAVAVTGTRGQISFTATTPAIGNCIVVTGTNSGTSTGITAGNYFIVVNPSTSTATLSATPGGAPITTTAGTTTGLTFTRQFITVTYSAQSNIPFGLNALIAVSGINNATSGTYMAQGTSTTTSVLIGVPTSAVPTLSGSQSLSLNSVSAAGAGLRVRAYPLATPMNSGNRVELINHNASTATYRADTFVISSAAYGTTGTARVTVGSTNTTFANPVVFPNYTVAALTLATRTLVGAVGWQVAVSDSPTTAGRMAYWSTTATAGWRYIDTNGAV